MRTIYKYEITTTGIVDLPQKAQIIDFNYQDAFYIWCIVDLSLMGVERKTFCIVGTGQSFTPDMTYIKTCYVGEFVWHLFEQTTNPR